MPSREHNKKRLYPERKIYIKVEYKMESAKVSERKRERKIFGLPNKYVYISCV